MPTYDYACARCDHQDYVLQSIGSYLSAPIRPHCPHHGEMERRLNVVPAMNALAGDRHYDGMRASDGTDISTRTKHREYMKSRGLTTADDFQQKFKQEASARQEFRSAKYKDQDLRQEITQQVMTAVAQPD